MCRSAVAKRSTIVAAGSTAAIAPTPCPAYIAIASMSPSMPESGRCLGGRGDRHRNVVLGPARPHPAVGVLATRRDPSQRRARGHRTARGSPPAVSRTPGHDHHRPCLRSSPAWPARSRTPPRRSRPSTPARSPPPGQARARTAPEAHAGAVAAKARSATLWQRRLRPTARTTAGSQLSPARRAQPRSSSPPAASVARVATFEPVRTWSARQTTLARSRLRSYSDRSWRPKWRNLSRKTYAIRGGVGACVSS